MSYILDALKKSEKEHRRRKSPGPLTGPEMILRPPKKSAHWPYILAFALLLNAGMLLWWIRPWHQERGTAPAPEQLAAGRVAQPVREISPGPPAPVQEKAAEPVKHEQTRVPEQDSLVKQVALPPTESPKEEVQAGAPAVGEKPLGNEQGPQKDEKPASQSPEPPQVVSPPAVAMSPGPPAIPDPVKPVPPAPVTPKVSKAQQLAASQSRPQAGTTDNLVKSDTAKLGKSKQPDRSAKAELPGKRQAHTPVQPGRAAGSKSLVSDLEALANIESPSTKSAGSARSLRLHELPANVRGSVPKLSMSMLIHSKNSQERWVHINGSKRREGQEISAGLKLEEITPDGAVFSYHGYRFFKPVVGD